MTETSKILLAALLVAISFLGLSLFRAEAKRPSFRNSTWICQQEEFLADVGNMTTTFTLRFLSGKKCIFQREVVIPSHKAMRMNPDGTVDTIPESKSTTENGGTWKYRGDTLTITFEDGTTMSLNYSPQAPNRLLSRNGIYTRQVVANQ